MRMAKDGRLCKRAASEWPQILRQVIPPEVWRAFCGQVPRGRIGQHWTAKYIVLCWALMGWAARPGLGARFAQSRAALAVLWPSRRQPGRTIQGLLKAGRRLTAAAFLHFWRCLRGHVAQRLGATWRWYDWVVFAVDGSRIEAPRTRANEKGLGCAGRTKTGPQWYVTTLIHLPSRLLWSWRQGRGTSSERGHLRQMLAELPPAAFLLADAGFVGYALLRALQTRRVDFLIRCGGNVRLLLADTRQRIEDCGTSRRVYLWPQKRRRRPPLILRLIHLKRAGQSIYLLTNVLATTQLSARRAGELYAARWGVEVNFRSLKQTLERRRLLARTPASGALELAGNLVALGLLLAHAAWRLRQAAERASVAAWLRLLRQAVAALVYQRRSPWFWRCAGRALRDDYRRRRSKRARDWPHKKHDPPAGAPQLRRLTPREKSVIHRLYPQARAVNG